MMTHENWLGQFNFCLIHTDERNGKLDEIDESDEVICG
jgi:hypothetical protein